MKFYKKGIVFLLTTLFSAVFIFADYNTLEAARKTVIQRDTRIIFKA